jgi:uncharacterized protein YjbI with pentapeptide repeats
MADPQHLALLRQGTEVWNRWREENPGTEPDFRGADLRGADLNEAKLAGADLSGADLSGADLRGADLSGADLRGIDLRYARNLTQEQIDAAKGDGTTQLPSNLQIPNGWKK